jgi:hypothetical protein
MAFEVSQPEETDRKVDWIASWNEYWIPRSRDQKEAKLLEVCPWCGKRLPELKRELWFKTMYTMGVEEPAKQDVPAEYRSDRWWRGLEN